MKEKNPENGFQKPEIELAPEEKKQLIFEKARNLFCEISSDFRYYYELENKEDLESDERLKLEDWIKYEAIKKLQEGNAEELLDWLKETIVEEKRKIEEWSKEHGFEREIKKSENIIEKCKELEDLTYQAYPTNLEKHKERTNLISTEESRRNEYIEIAKNIFIEWKLDGQTCYEALCEMKTGHPEKAIELIESAIAICRTVASNNLDNTFGTADIEESDRLQGEFIAMEKITREIKTEYHIPIEMTPSLKREMRGRKIIKEKL